MTNSDRSHRTSTPLELLFDLVTVIAIASASAGLHHAVVSGHSSDGVVRFAMAFFTIWLAWMNYTWFASAYNKDDVVFRLLTMLTMCGALIMASGIDRFFTTLDMTMFVLGYVVMRVAMIVLWVRAGFANLAWRRTALSYAIGMGIVQLYWVGLLGFGQTTQGVLVLLFVTGATLELLVPAIAERSGQTPWHRGHIIERYGLLTLIVLGEALLSASSALRTASGGDNDPWLLARLALTAVVSIFAMWWLYFAKEEHLPSQKLGQSLIWGYGHILIFASGAAVGAGFAVAVDVVTGTASASSTTASIAVAIPVAVYLIALWLVRDRLVVHGAGLWALPIAAATIALIPLLSIPIEAIAAALTLCVIVRSTLIRRVGAA